MREITTGVQHVPWGPELRGASASRVFIAKAVNGPVPHGLECLDEHVFPEGNPYVVNDKMANKEIREVQVLGRSHG